MASEIPDRHERRPPAPANWEELVRQIHSRHDGLSRTNRKISVFLIQNPNDVAMQSVNAIAERCGVHASSFVRYAQALGFAGFRQLQALFQARLTTAAPGFEARIRALESELGARGHATEQGFLHDLVLRDVASLQALVASIPAGELTRAADLLAAADTVYLAGQLRSGPVVQLLHYVLTMLGKPSQLLDASGGLSTHVARMMRTSDLLFAVSFRFYATEVLGIADEAAARGVPILAISDSSLSPLAKTATVLFAVPEPEYTFSRSLAAPMCLAQALMVSLAARIQGNARPRIPVVTGDQA
jgi:DNA-binding MurR/RpiR family transcriptional regulator